MKRKRLALALGLGALAAGTIMAVEVAIAIRAPRLPAAAPYQLDREVPGAVRKVVWLGDSTAAGVGASTEGAALPRQVANRSSDAEDLKVFAVSGARVADVVSDQLPLMKAQPDVVFVSVGANDTTNLTKAGDFERTYETLLQELGGVPQVVLLGVPDMGSPTRFPQPLRAIVGTRGNALDERVKTLALRHGRIYVDIADTTGPAFRAEPEKYFADDEFHPSDAGYGLWADSVMRTLRAPANGL